MAKSSSNAKMTNMVRKVQQELIVNGNKSGVAKSPDYPKPITIPKPKTASHGKK
jgi:hypothetical protein